MSRLIDADMVLTKQIATGLSDADGNYYGNANVVFADDIENAPTVDAVEVTRCKDCKYHENMSVPEYKHCYMIDKTVWHNAFCYYGESITEEEEQWK